jgi:ribonuclease BN (tRNA processing enzyme)
MSFLVRRDGRPFLLDAGSGLGRLLAAPLCDALAGIDRLDVVLTHYHLDHVIGLSYLPAIVPSTPVRIYAPAPPLVDGTPAEALERLIAPPLFPLRLAELPMGVEVVPYAGDRLEVAGARLRLRRQRHSGGSVGLVIDERLAYCTDCEVDDGSLPFVRGVELLLHEMWVTDAEATNGAHRAGHSTVEEVARLADGCGARVVMPVHHHPKRTADDLRQLTDRLAELTRTDVVLADEGREYTLPL